MSNQTQTDGGPAFARAMDSWGNVNDGMSLRDYFAAHEQIPDADDVPLHVKMLLAGDIPSGDMNQLRWDAKWRAELRLLRADAMLAARGGAS